MRREWKESEERIGPLPEHDPNTFKLYLGWVYQKRIIVSAVGLDDVIENGELRRLCSRAYLLGEYHQDGDFKDAVIDALIGVMKTTRFPYYTFGINVIYNSTPKDSPLRRLFVDQLIYTNANNFQGRLDALQAAIPPTEVLYEIILAMSKMKEKDIAAVSKAPFSNTTCHYHVHGAENPCYKVKHKITGLVRPT